MASGKELRRRITSVKNTQQITKAMKMVSAAKLRRAQDAIVQARPYANAIRQATRLVTVNPMVCESHPLLARREALEEHLWRGGRLSLGVIPTGATSNEIRGLDPREVFMGLMEAFSKNFRDRPELVARTLRESLYTPACGLGLHSPEDTEAVLEKLLAFKSLAGELLARGRA